MLLALAIQSAGVGVGTALGVGLGLGYRAWRGNREGLIGDSVALTAALVGLAALALAMALRATGIWG